MRALATLIAVAFLAVGAYTATRMSDRASMEPPEPELVEPQLGPVDGRDLPPTDIGRVAVGSIAPDFALESYAGPVIQLSDYRGKKDVVLVFYRGHW